MLYFLQSDVSVILGVSDRACQNPKGIIMASRYGFSHCEMESDSLNAIHLLLNHTKNAKEEGLIVEDVLHLNFC